MAMIVQGVVGILASRWRNIALPYAGIFKRLLVNRTRIIGVRIGTGIMAVVVQGVVGILAPGWRNITGTYAGIFNRVMTRVGNGVGGTLAHRGRNIAGTDAGILNRRIIAMILDLVGHCRGG
ncbi:MAG: hypothetical protein H0X71_06720 [Rubrobacter sp.]|nr:hypothetical protein [Rubrobacter sp.]